MCVWGGEVYNMKYPAAAKSEWVTGFQTSNLSKNRGAGIRPCRQQPGPLGKQNFYGKLPCGLQRVSAGLGRWLTP